jgi:hypothetical protein
MKNVTYRQTFVQFGRIYTGVLVDICFGKRVEAFDVVLGHFMSRKPEKSRETQKPKSNGQSCQIFKEVQGCQGESIQKLEIGKDIVCNKKSNTLLAGARKISL